MKTLFIIFSLIFLLNINLEAQVYKFNNAGNEAHVNVHYESSNWQNIALIIFAHSSGVPTSSGSGASINSYSQQVTIHVRNQGFLMTPSEAAQNGYFWDSSGYFYYSIISMTVYGNSPENLSDNISAARNQLGRDSIE